MENENKCCETLMEVENDLIGMYLKIYPSILNQGSVKHDNSDKLSTLKGKIRELLKEHLNG